MNGFIVFLHDAIQAWNLFALLKQMQSRKRLKGGDLFINLDRDNKSLTSIKQFRRRRNEQLFLYAPHTTLVSFWKHRNRRGCPT